MSDDNVIRFRKPPPPKKPQKPEKPLPVSPWVIVILAGLAIGGVTYLLDQQKGATPPRVAVPR